MPEEEVAGFDEVLDQLRIQNRLAIMQILRTPGITQTDVIGALASTGAPAKEIARLLGTTTGTVQVAMSRHRKKDKGESK